MESAVDHLSKQRYAQATKAQRHAVERRLEELLDELAGSRSSGIERPDPSAAMEPPPSPARQDGSEARLGAAGARATRGSASHEDRQAIAKLVKDRWGNLPERERDEMLQPLSEDFAPEYAAEIEQYFRALAEPAAEAPASQERRRP